MTARTNRKSISARPATACSLPTPGLGQGHPLVKTGHWMTHIEFDFESPIWRHLYQELSRDHAFFRYDARGNGLSDREVPDVTFERFVDDLEAVVDAAGIDRFALLGISQGCAVSIAYAVRHPERVSHLILLGGYAVGWKKRARTEADKAAGEAMLTLMRLGWGQENPAFRQMFTSQFIPDANKEQADWFNELQRISSSPDDAARNLLANGEVDVSSLLPQVKVPTLVMHCRHDARVPFEAGRRLAAGIPGARFVPLESRNHIMLEGEPALARFSKSCVHSYILMLDPSSHVRGWHKCEVARRPSFFRYRTKSRSETDVPKSANSAAGGATTRPVVIRIAGRVRPFATNAQQPRGPQGALAALQTTTENRPTGKSAKTCPALRAKIFRLTRRANHLYKLAPSHPMRGGSRVVTNARWDAMDATASGAQRDRRAGVPVSDRPARGRTALPTVFAETRRIARGPARALAETGADGEVVWSWRPDAGVKSCGDASGPTGSEMHRQSAKRRWQESPVTGESTK